MNERSSAKQKMMRQLRSVSSLLLVVAGVAIAVGGATRQENISVSVSSSRVPHGERVEITLQVSRNGVPSREPVKAVLLRPSAGAETLTLRAASRPPGAYRAESAGYRVALVNHNDGEIEVELKPLAGLESQTVEWIDLLSQSRIKAGGERFLKLRVPGGGVRCVEFRRTAPK